MEKDQPANLEYQGDSPRWAAAKEFFTTTAFWTVGVELVLAMGVGLFSRGKSNNVIDEVAETLKSRSWRWELPLAISFGAWDAKNTYDKAKGMQSQHNKLVHDNIAMRAQLDQTGQILRHVASEVEKGKLPDSQMVLDETKVLPSHVAKLEAQEAASAAQTALAKL